MTGVETVGDRRPARRGARRGAADRRAAPPARSEPARALLLTGTVGVGKTTRGARRSVTCCATPRCPNAVVDVDWLRAAWPAPPGDPFNEALALRNLAAVARQLPRRRRRPAGPRRRASRRPRTGPRTPPRSACRSTVVRLVADPDVAARPAAAAARRGRRGAPLAPAPRRRAARDPGGVGRRGPRRRHVTARSTAEVAADCARRLCGWTLVASTHGRRTRTRARGRPRRRPVPPQGGPRRHARGRRARGRRRLGQRLARPARRRRPHGLRRGRRRRGAVRVVRRDAARLLQADLRAAPRRDPRRPGQRGRAAGRVRLPRRRRGTAARSTPLRSRPARCWCSRWSGSSPTPSRCRCWCGARTSR